MNDPHVIALFYHIKHGDSVDYSNAEPFIREEKAFRLEVKDKQVRFELKDHYASEEEARKAIEHYIRTWEFTVGLDRGPGCFRLRFDLAQIKDRNPTPGVVEVSCTARAGAPTARISATVDLFAYPPPPSGIKLTPDVQTMYDRYMGYRQGREPLTGMAYFCLTILESSTKKNCKKNHRMVAAEMYGIEPKVLNDIGHLSSNKGGQQARKAEGKGNDLTAQDHRFLEKAIKAVIRRVAEKAYHPERDLPQILLSDLQNRP